MKKWYKVLTFGGRDSAVKKSEEEAIRSFRRENGLASPDDDYLIGQEWARLSARTARFPTRAAARKADISDYDKHGGETV